MKRVFAPQTTPAVPELLHPTQQHPLLELPPSRPSPLRPAPCSLQHPGAASQRSNLAQGFSEPGGIILGGLPGSGNGEGVMGKRLASACR